MAINCTQFFNLVPEPVTVDALRDHCLHNYPAREVDGAIGKTLDILFRIADANSVPHAATAAPNTEGWDPAAWIHKDDLLAGVPSSPDRQERIKKLLYVISGSLITQARTGQADTNGEVVIEGPWAAVHNPDRRSHFDFSYISRRSLMAVVRAYGRRTAMTDYLQELADAA